MRRPIFDPTIQLVVVNLYTTFESSILNCCGDIFDEKSAEKEKRIQGRTNRRRPIFNPTIQLVVVNQYTKFEVSILNGCGDIFDEKSGEKEKKIIGKNNKVGRSKPPLVLTSGFNRL